MEVYFDNVTLAPDGAEVNVNCSLGSIEIYVPSHWRVIDNLSASLGNAEVSRKLQSNDADAPTLRVTGSVSMGNVEVKRIK
jgi:predicted membrane protein